MAGTVPLIASPRLQRPTHEFAKGSMPGWLVVDVTLLCSSQLWTKACYEVGGLRGVWMLFMYRDMHARDDNTHRSPVG